MVIRTVCEHVHCARVYVQPNTLNVTLYEVTLCHHHWVALEHSRFRNSMPHSVLLLNTMPYESQSLVGIGRSYAHCHGLKFAATNTR